MLNILEYEKMPEFRNGLTAVAHADVMYKLQKHYLAIQK